MKNFMKNFIAWVIGIVIIISFFGVIEGIGKYEGRSAEGWYNQYDEVLGEVDNLQSEVEDLQSEVEDLQSALQKANNHIEEANSSIDSAKGYAWETYDEMGEALDSLDTVDTVYNIIN